MGAQRGVAASLQMLPLLSFWGVQRGGTPRGVTPLGTGVQGGVPLEVARHGGGKGASPRHPSQVKDPLPGPSRQGRRVRSKVEDSLHSLRGWSKGPC